MLPMSNMAPSRAQDHPVGGMVKSAKARPEASQEKGAVRSGVRSK